MPSEIALRPRQKNTVERAIAALRDRKNTIVVAPTGYGKTVVASGILGEYLTQSGRALVLQHRQELLRQNRDKFARMNPGLSTSVVDGVEKNFGGQVIFASNDTIRRANWLSQLPEFQITMVDEVHHCRSRSYMNVLRHVKALPDETGERGCVLFGLTATPERTDRKQLGVVFDNCADQVRYAELIIAGQLVPPRTFTPNQNLAIRQALDSVRKRAGEFDEEEVAKILNVAEINSAVVRHWQDKARDRKTIVFCSTVAHAKAVAAEFRRAGVKAASLDATTSKGEREEVLQRLKYGDMQVVTNVAVLTEGFDAPPVSCIIILRVTASRGPFVQMIGRGLRTIDAREFPTLIKDDCLVFDWGTSTDLHGAIEKGVELVPRDSKPGEPATKSCPNCGFENPLAALECLSCGEEFPSSECELQLTLEDLITLEEHDVTENSPFRWETLNDRCIVASGMKVVAVLAERGGHWHAFSIDDKKNVDRIMTGRKAIALAAADTFLQSTGESAAHKTRGWLAEPATEKQCRFLHARCSPKLRHWAAKGDRYTASCAIGLELARRQLEVAYKAAAQLSKHG